MAEHGLNPEQERAVHHGKGPLLILAGAGSGKTRVITHRIAYLIREMGVDPYNILAITFTNKAAREMRERVDRLVDEGAESIWVSTFHSLCVRILRRFHDKLGGKNNFTIYDTDDQKAVIRESLKALNMDEKKFPVRMLISAIGKAKENFLTPSDMELKGAGNYHDRNVAEVYREYQNRLRLNNALDFDDLINRTIELFMENPDVLNLYQERFRYIMVDEYQDTNHAQFILVKQLAAKYRNLCVVGDDDQSIYKFRGANIYNILNFEDEYPDATVIKLEQNYRSTANILNAANGVIACNSGRKDKSLWTENEEGEKLSFTRYESDRAEAAGVFRNMVRESGRDRHLSDMAILYRTNAQSRVLEEQFIRQGIPYQLVGGTNFYDRKEIRDLVGYLKVIYNPVDTQSLIRIINVPRRGIGDSTVNKMREFAESSGFSLYDVVVEARDIPGLGRSAGKVAAFGEMMQEFRRKAEENDLTGLFNLILARTGYRKELELENTEEAKGRIENIDELGNKIADFELSREGATLMDLLEEISLVADTDSGESEGERVTLMTLHSAKGLEFPVVFMVGMEERLFPSGMSLDSDDPDAEEEERRLCYVGITRAMKKLYLSAAAQRMVNGQYTYPGVSRFVREIPRNLLQMDPDAERALDKEEDREEQWPPSGSYGGFGRRGSSYGGGERYGGGDRYDEGDSRGKRYDEGYSRGDRYDDEWRGSTFQPKKPAAVNKPVSRPAASPSGSGTGGEFVPGYGVGDRVRHIKYGTGTVKLMEKGGKDYEVVVNFAGVGEKRMFASLAKLRKV